MKSINYEDLVAGMKRKELSPWERFESEFETLRTLHAIKNLAGLYLKKMFGGLAIYRKNTLCLVLMENTDTSEWNGILVCTSREHSF